MPNISKYLEPSFEHLIRRSRTRARTPAYRQPSSVYQPALSHSYRSKSYHGELNNLSLSTLHDSISRTQFRSSRTRTPPYREYSSARQPLLSHSYRSKSYHGELHNVSASILNDSVWNNYARYTSHRDLPSLYAYDLNSSHNNFVDDLNRSYINIYSHHHNHHSQAQAKSQLNSRNRFKSRAFRAIRSRSANPPDRTSVKDQYFTRGSMECDYVSPLTSSHNDFTQKPMFSTKLMERSATENSSITLTCNVLGADSHVKWLKNRRELMQSPRHRNTYRDGLAMLEIFSARTDDTAEYTCVARNRFGENSCSSLLKVFPDYERKPMLPIFTRPIKGKLIQNYQFFINKIRNKKNERKYLNLNKYGV